jgi:hypothetical protein
MAPLSGYFDALGQKFRPRGPVYGAVHSPAPQEARIGGVYNGVNFKGGNVTAQ